MHKTLIFFSLLLTVNAAVAQSAFVKYKNYLIPIGGGVDVETLGVSDVTNTEALVELALNTGEENTLVWFVAGTSSNLVCKDNDMSPYSTRINPGESFSTYISNLIADTRYYYRACAVNERGTISAGNIDDFKTTNNLRTVSKFASNVTNSSAKLNATLTAGRGAKVWFIFNQGFSLSSCSGTSNSNAQMASAGGNFSQNLINLIPAQIYTFRACASNNDGLIVGSSSKTFTTGDANTEVITLDPYSVSSNSVELQGEVVSGTNVSAFFVLDEDNSVTCPSGSKTLFPNARFRNTGDTVKLSLDETDNGSTSSGEGLLSNKKYYYRFCARNSRLNQNAQGDLKSFVTKGDSDSLALSIVSRSDDNATFSGSLVRAGLPKRTWFIIVKGEYIFNNYSCSFFTKNSVKVLNSTFEKNEFTNNNLDVNTSYSVGFCGESLTADSDEAILGGQRIFKTKRNNSVVAANCGSTEYSSADGPLNIQVIIPHNLPSLRPYPIVTIRNESYSNFIRWRILESGFGAANGFNRQINPRTRISQFVSPVLNSGTGVQATRRYQVFIPASNTDNWKATLGCPSANCLNNPSIHDDNSCSDVRPI